MTYRVPRGEAHHNAKLTAEDVRIIRQCAEERARLRAEALQLSNTQLARKFGVAPTTIERIISRERWGAV